MKGTASWMDEQNETTFAEAQAAFEGLDVEPTALQRGRTESEITGMARLARETGERDRRRILQLANAEGKALGARAYYSFPMGGKTVSGPTIQLANALANVWGDLAIQISDKELEGQELRLTVRVMDLRSGVMQERPHFYTLTAASGKFAKNTENKSRWMAMQAQSAVSKAIRTTLFNLLPDWVTSTALAAARASSQVQASPERIRDAVSWWADQGVSLEQLVELVGEPPDRWSNDDLTKVRDLGKAMKDGEITKAEIFGAGSTKPATAKKAGQPTGADALGGKATEPEKKPSPTADPAVDAARAEAMKARITDALTKLGAKAKQTLDMFKLPADTPVANWTLNLGQLEMAMNSLEGFAGIGQPQGDHAGMSRDELKTAIQAELGRLGKDLFCQTLGLAPATFEPVITWRYRDNTLRDLLAKLEAVEVEQDPSELAVLQARVQEVFDEVSGFESTRDAACWAALAEASVPEVPHTELTAEQCNTAIEALQDLGRRTAEQ